MFEGWDDMNVEYKKDLNSSYIWFEHQLLQSCLKGKKPYALNNSKLLDFFTVYIHWIRKKVYIANAWKVEVKQITMPKLPMLFTYSLCLFIKSSKF